MTDPLPDTCSPGTKSDTGPDAERDIGTDADSGQLQQPDLLHAALFGMCPRCGSRTLFAGVIKFAKRCTACGLDISAFNVGDGPAAFLTLLIGTVITALAIWLELALEPPFWVHIILWVPLTIAAVVVGLRGAKGALLAAEYQRSAGQIESRYSDEPPREP